MCWPLGALAALSLGSARADSAGELPRTVEIEVNAEAPSQAPTEAQGAPAPAKLGAANRVEGDEAPGLVAFTFDDGPSPYTTPRVLRALAKYRVPATFFVVNRHLVGKRGEAGRPLLSQITAEGHLIGSHTANHANLGTTTRTELRIEVDDAVANLAQLLGNPVELFRPPYGDLSKKAARRVAELGLTDVRWSVDPKDFHRQDPEQLRRAVIDDLVEENGGIVLLHDTKQATASTLDDLLRDLERLNCRRMGRGKPPLLPVSLHYFLRDGAAARPIPPEVAARTDSYKSYLEERCRPEERSVQVADEAPTERRRKKRRHKRSRHGRAQVPTDSKLGPGDLSSI